MTNRLRALYLYVQAIPDRMYPFRNEIEGKFVRGRASYTKALSEAFLRYGPNHYGYKLIIYRGTCHFVASILFVILATFLSQRLFGSEVALYVMMGIMIVGIFIQEFYWQPRTLGQLRHKGVVDCLSWAVPMWIYISFFL